MTSPPTKGASPWAVKIARRGKEQGLPVNIIRQKLVLEGLEPDLIDTVLSGDLDISGRSLETPDRETSSPPASPVRRQVSARKFHDMLMVGLPPTAVRQKMAMEGCPPEDINNFFALQSSGGKAEKPWGA